MVVCRAPVFYDGIVTQSQAVGKTRGNPQLTTISEEFASVPLAAGLKMTHGHQPRHRTHDRRGAEQVCLGRGGSTR